MDVRGLKSLIEGGEGQELEFKKSLAARDEAIETVAAFANRQGGIVVFGVDDAGRVVGCSVGTNTLAGLANQLRAQLDPSIMPPIRTVEVDGHLLVVIEVEAQLGVTYANGRAFVRAGPSNHPMAGAEQQQRHAAAAERWRAGDPTLNARLTITIRRSVATSDVSILVENENTLIPAHGLQLNIDVVRAANLPAPTFDLNRRVWAARVDPVFAIVTPPFPSDAINDSMRVRRRGALHYSDGRVRAVRLRRLALGELGTLEVVANSANGGKASLTLRDAEIPIHDDRGVRDARSARYSDLTRSALGYVHPGPLGGSTVSKQKPAFWEFRRNPTVHTFRPYSPTREFWRIVVDRMGLSPRFPTSVGPVTVELGPGTTRTKVLLARVCRSLRKREFSITTRS